VPCLRSFFFCFFLANINFGVFLTKMTKDPYEVLGVGRFTTQKEIRKRYLQLCKKHHPDVAVGKAVDFTDITVAYEMLINKEKMTITSNNSKPSINTSLWTKRSYFAGFAIVAFTLVYFYEKPSDKSSNIIPHLPNKTVPEQVKSDIPPWQAAGTSFREWRKK
jgi:hypothetical protein